METNKAKSNDPSDYHGGINRMDKIDKSIEELLLNIRESKIYEEYKKQEEILIQDPEMMERVRKFRANNFRIQNELIGEDLFRVVDQLSTEAAEIRKDPRVNAYLDAELALCKLFQSVCKRLSEGLDVDIPIL